MSAWRFKVGDRVQIIDDKNVLDVFRGAICVITDLGETTGRLEVIEYVGPQGPSEAEFTVHSQQYFYLISHGALPELQEESLFDVLGV